jgi:hypothetical protein
VRIGRVEAAPGEQAPNAGADGAEEPRHLGVARGRDRMKLQRAIGRGGEDAVEGERVEVYVEIHPPLGGEGAFARVAHLRLRTGGDLMMSTQRADARFRERQVTAAAAPLLVQDARDLRKEPSSRCPREPSRRPTRPGQITHGGRVPSGRCAYRWALLVPIGAAAPCCVVALFGRAVTATVNPRSARVRPP